MKRELVDKNGLIRFKQKIIEKIPTQVSKFDNDAQYITKAELNNIIGSTNSGDTDEYEYVDLGLPSGTLWATKNIGAKDEYDAGLYFQWGDTQGYTADQVGKDKVFNWQDYKFGNNKTREDNRNLTKYNGDDGKTLLDIEDDAAYVNMGAKFRMPTIDEFIELCNNTNYQFIDDNNGKYMKFTSKTDESKFIVLPAAGIASGSTFALVTHGCYWSSSLNDNSYVDFSRYLNFYNNGYVENSSNYRRNGFPVRGVVNPNYKEPTLMDTINTKLSADDLEYATSEDIKTILNEL